MSWRVRQATVVLLVGGVMVGGLAVTCPVWVPRLARPFMAPVLAHVGPQLDRVQLWAVAALASVGAILGALGARRYGRRLVTLLDRVGAFLEERTRRAEEKTRLIEARTARLMRVYRQETKRPPIGEVETGGISGGSEVNGQVSAGLSQDDCPTGEIALLEGGSQPVRCLVTGRSPRAAYGHGCRCEICREWKVGQNARRSRSAAR